MDAVKIRKIFVIVQALSLMAVFHIADAAIAATKCEILSIKASSDGKGVDPAVARYAKIFKNEPFAKFNSFALIDRQPVDIELNVPKNLKLPENISASLKLNKYSDGKFDLTLALSRLSKSPVNINGIASPGSPIFAAGMKSDNGIWIFGVVCDGPEVGITP